VLALDEAKRKVLFLRYHEGLEPAAIAARLGLPVKTVKTRLARGLAELRERLERRYGGDRRALGLVLTALARGPAVQLVTTAIGGGLAMKWVLGVAAAVVAWLGWQGTRSRPGEEVRELGRPGEMALAELSGGSTEARLAREAPLRTARAPAEPVPAAYVLTGIVRKREDGSVVVGAAVEILQQGLRTTTDDEGRYRFETSQPVTVATLRVCPTVSTAASERVLGQRLRAAEPTVADLWVTGGARLSGRVVDTRGDPVADATVRAWCDARFEPSRADDRRAASSANGTFMLEHLGQHFVLYAERPGLACLYGLRGSLAAGAEAAELEVVMDEAVFLRGHVVDEDGRPIEGAELDSAPHRSSGDSDATSVAGVQRFYAHDVRTRTGLDGSFALGPVARRTWNARVTHAGHLLADVELDPEEADARIVLSTGHRLGGVVLGVDGEPVPGAKVSVHPQGSEGRSTTTDASGNFEVQALTATENGFVVVVADEHAVHARQPVAIGPDAPSFLELRLERPTPLAGRVVDATGAPIADALVRAEGERRIEYENVNFGEVTTGSGGPAATRRAPTPRAASASRSSTRARSSSGPRLPMLPAWARRWTRPPGAKTSRSCSTVPHSKA
jgi:protocatechuate 3,4-dioxygenase beta subunit